MAAPVVHFVRPLYPPSHDKGPSKPYSDIEAVKRAISRAGFWPWQEFDQNYSEKFAMEGVKPFQQHFGLNPTGYYGEPTHSKLVNTRKKGSKTEWAFDKTAILMMEKADKEINMKPENKALSKARAMLAYCKLFDGPYSYGGQHDRTFADDDPHDAFDCSSSTSFVLWKFNLLGSSMVDAYLGKISLSLTGEQTRQLVDHPSSKDGKFTGVWDIQWTPAGLQPRTLCQGKVECVADVTR